MSAFSYVYSTQPSPKCAFLAAHAQVLAVGSYSLHADDGTSRCGAIQLYSWHSRSLQLSRTLAVNGGVFRSKWILDSAEQPLLVSALTSGRVHVWHDRAAVGEEAALCSDAMLLCVDATPDASLLVAGDERGRLHVAPRERPTDADSWAAHALPFSADCGAEVWAVAIADGQPFVSRRANWPFSRRFSHVVYSGADDALLKVWDCRTRSKAVASVEGHGAGVTWVQAEGDVVLTGSYDESLRVWDARRLQTGATGSLALGGGVWCADRQPRRRTRLLVACMYNGWAVVDVSTPTPQLVSADAIVGQHLLYGAAWSRANTCNADDFAVCTFNDSCLRLCTTTEQ